MDHLAPILAELEPTLGQVVGVPEPLDGGITNRNYHVRFGETDCVVRLPGKDTELLGISRQAERMANDAAARLSLAPRVITANDHAIITRFVECSAIEADALRAEPGPLARGLRAFHDSGVELPVRFWVPDLLEDYARIVGDPPPEYATTHALAARIAAALPLSDPVPCHNDLLAGNLLQTRDAILLVDWEYAGMGHRLFDLGNLAVNNEFDDAAEERLLAAYFGEPPTEGRRAALKLMRLMSDAREAAWGVVQGVISELDFDFGDYAARHFARLAAAAEDPDFERWLDGASS